MTDEQTEDPSLWAAVDATSSFDSDEESLEALVQLKEVDFGDRFTNRETQLESDDGQGISIRFFHDEAHNSLSLRTDSESTLKIHLRLVDGYVEESAPILNKILPFVGPISVDMVFITKEFNLPFESLNLPIQSDTDLDIVGIRIRRYEADLIIQETDDSDIDATMRREVSENFEDTIPNDFVLADIDQVTRFVEEEL